MSESPGWQWVGRTADVAGVVAGVLAPVGLAVVALVKKRQLVHAVGWDVAWLCGVGVLALVGAALFVTGIRGRLDVMSTFATDRGRGNTVLLFVGSALLLLALLGLLTL